MRALLLLLLLTLPILGQSNHYIRAGASGANDGSDWTNAFTSFPATLTRGDTYYVADGAYSPVIFDDAESGTTVIYIKKATAASHGTETGWDSTNGTTLGSPYNVDMDGVTRGQGSSWDIGAFEYVAGGGGGSTLSAGTVTIGP